MKKVFTLILIGFTVITFAQNKPAYKGSFSQMTPEQQAITQTKQMTLDLDLSEAQQNKVLELNKTAALEREKMRAKKEESKKTAAEMTSDEKFEMKNQRLDTQLKHQNELKKIMNEKQYEDWKKMQETRKKQAYKGHQHGQMQKNK